MTLESGMTSNMTNKFLKSVSVLLWKMILSLYSVPSRCIVKHCPGEENLII